MQLSMSVKQRRGVGGVIPVIMTIIMGFRCVWGLSVSSYVQDDDGITCTCDKGVMKVKICREDIVRVAYSPTSTIPARPLSAVVDVDYELPGCPMVKEEFLDFVKAILAGRTWRLPDDPRQVTQNSHERMDAGNTVHENGIRRHDYAADGPDQGQGEQIDRKRHVYRSSRCGHSFGICEDDDPGYGSRNFHL